MLDCLWRGPCDARDSCALRAFALVQARVGHSLRIIAASFRLLLCPEHRATRCPRVRPAAEEAAGRVARRLQSGARASCNALPERRRNAWTHFGERFPRVSRLEIVQIMFWNSDLL